MLIDEGLELLDEHEAFGLLSAGEIGRIGLNVGGVPAIFPVNYRVIDGAVVVRTSPGTKLSAAIAGAIVAFEVDEVDFERRAGWSVLIVGQAEVLRGLRPTLDVIESGLEPFVDGPRIAMIRITPTSISGRRIVHDPDWATP